MPAPLLASLFGDEASRDDYLGVWCTTLDFALSFGDLTEQEQPRDSLGFLHGAYRELTGAVSLLLERRPTAKAGHSAMMAVETIGKWFLSEHGRSIPDLKKLRHDVVAIVAECNGLMPGGGLEAWKGGVRALPQIEERYSATEPPGHVLWSHYRTALFVGAAMMRQKTGRDCMSGRMG
jgi:hypothetical protein